MRILSTALIVAAVWVLLPDALRAQVPATCYRVETLATPEGIAPEVSAVATTGDGRLIIAFRLGTIWWKRIDEALRSGDPDAEFWGKVSRKQIKIASRIEGEIYNYYRNTGALGPKNRADMEIGILKRIWADPHGTTSSSPATTR